MEQREITGPANVTWTCVQAYAGLEANAEKAAEIVRTGDKVPVVCTPSGGAQSVRLELVHNWMEKLSDDELLDQIATAQQSS
ncbi:hypothetical protein EXU57_20415 [Segetibacter sp. 3557_3]|uniref:hypothetical protein n=1 Tax=Segetibacter sp. 3557_3 TaxID=2547429 RepID=UPI001058829C|nr:hypothetical protein [Segetibacter sp. 3557_3]TDH21303.1 hypothetical protein EXU57_20415 [Segetibacter sp. 3557_3]